MAFSARIFSRLQQQLPSEPEGDAEAEAKRFFEARCREGQYAFVRISQDQTRDQDWFSERVSRGRRGDYLIRKLNGENEGNGKNACGPVEVKVECKYIHGLASYQYLSLPKRHLWMPEEAANPVVFAFFVRDGRGAVKDSLRMIALDDLLCDAPGHKGIIYSDLRKVLLIPQSAMVNGFDLLEGRIQSPLSENFARGRESRQ